MNDLDKAISEISTIRQQVLASSTFKGLGAAVVGCTGLMAALVSYLQLQWTESFAADNVSMLLVWIVTAIVAVTVIGIEMLYRSKRHHASLSNTMLLKAIENFIPSFVMGAITGFVILRFAPDIAWVLPGIWQMLIAVAIFSAMRFLPRAVMFASAWYLVAGAITLFIGATSGTLTPWMMGVPFMVGQLLMAAALYISLETNHE